MQPFLLSYQKEISTQWREIEDEQSCSSVRGGLELIKEIPLLSSLFDLPDSATSKLTSCPPPPLSCHVWKCRRMLHVYMGASRQGYSSWGVGAFRPHSKLDMSWIGMGVVSAACVLQWYPIERGTGSGKGRPCKSIENDSLGPGMANLPHAITVSRL